MLLLHLSDLHFGNKNRFANDNPSDLGRAFHRALQAASKEPQIPATMAVSLVIVTGDIVESGLPSEFRAALEFLKSLAEEMDLPRNRFVFLPGNHDISWADCRIVRAARDGEKFPAAEFDLRLNTEKLANYRAFLSDFYGKPVDSENLAELENVRSLGSGGWLRDFPDLRLSIAALNTSEREHDVSKGGFLSPEQAQALMTFWLEDASASRLKILALHHNPISATDANRDWVLDWVRNKEKAVGASVPMSADVFEHYIADIAGFIGSEHLPKIVEDTCPHIVLHGHHHDQGKPTSWHWKKNGNAPVLSVGSFGLNKDQLPGDAPLSCQFLRLVLPPEPTSPRLIAIPLIYDGRFRLEGDVLVGAFRAEAGSRAAYDQPLPLPKGWKVEPEPAPEPAIVDALPPGFLGKYEHLSYDRQPVYTRKLSDLNQELILEFLAKPLSQEQNAGLKRGKDGGSPTIEQKLEHLLCLYDGQPTLGALLCFAPSQLLADKAGCSTLQMAIHDGSERGGDNTTLKVARGNLLELFDMGMTWLTGGYVLRRRGEVGSKSRDEFEIPRKVLREALANAFVHRDYETMVLQSQPTRIDVYPDKVEVTSYGGLLEQVHLDQLNSPDQTLRAFRRNESIARIFQCMTDVELNASGIHRMRRLMTEAGMAFPLFRAGKDFVCVTLARPFELSSGRAVALPPQIDAEHATLRAFISCTGELIEHRRAAHDACLRAGVMPVMWEHFLPNSDTLDAILKQKIEEADLFICILGERYGSLPHNSEISFIEMEFNHAIARGLPVIVFTMHQDHPVFHKSIETEGSIEKLEKFKLRLRTERYAEEFKSPEDLRGRIIDGLHGLVAKHRAGEIRSAKTRPRPAVPNNLPYTSLGTLFKGRDSFLASLRDYLASQTPAVIRGAQAIHGMGGVGKTRAAVEYAWANESDYSALLFLTADSPDALARSLAALAGPLVLNLPEQEATDTAAQTHAVLRWLNQHLGWFLIIDNVDTIPAQVAVAALLTHIPRGHVLITTRLADWPANITSLYLDVLSEESSIAFMLEHTHDRRVRCDDDPVTAQKIARLLDGLALALEQSAAYIRARRCSLMDYLRDSESKRLHVLSSYDPNRSHYPRSIAITYDTSISQLTDDARTLLRIFSWLAPDPMPIALLEKLENVPDARVQLIALSDLHLATLNAEGTAFSVHRLLQEITRQQQPEEKPPALIAALSWVNDLVPFAADDVRTWPVVEPLASHATTVALSAADRHIPVPTARLLNQVALFYQAKAQHQTAEPLMRRALAMDEATFGKDHPEVAIRLNNLAALLQATNRLAEAEPLMRRTLAIGEANFGKDHPNVAIRLNNLAQLLQATNRLAEAEPLMRRALAVDEASFGEEHPNIASDLNNLAQLLQATNRLAEAEPLMRRALWIDEQSYGDEHPRVANALNNLAQLMTATNRLAEAEPLMRRALDIDEQAYGADHPSVAVDLNNLAQLLQSTNRLAEAEPLMRRGLAIYEQSLGPAHPNVAAALMNLAQILKATSRLPEAEALMRRALEIEEDAYGTEHPAVATDLNNLASLLMATDRLAEAEPMMRRSLAIDEKSYGRTHPNVAVRLNNLAHLLMATGRLPEAEALMQRLLQMLAEFSERTGHEHPLINSSLRNYIHLLGSLGLDESEISTRVGALLVSESVADTKRLLLHEK